MNDSGVHANGGFSLFISALALIVAMGALLAVAFKLNDNASVSPVAMHSSMHSSGSNAAPTQSSSGEEVKLVIKSDAEHGKMGSDGKWHDAFLPADFSVKAGATVRVVVLNYDDAEHSFTSSELGTNVSVAGGSETKPALTSFTFTAPEKAGRYEWFCAVPCDPWAMGQDGFMRGYVSVV